MSAPELSPAERAIVQRFGIHDDVARERKRILNTLNKRKLRAAMTPEGRAARRKKADENYREGHREERREYDRNRAKAHARKTWEGGESRR